MGRKKISESGQRRPVTSDQETRVVNGIVDNKTPRWRSFVAQEARPQDDSFGELGNESAS